MSDIFDALVGDGPVDSADLVSRLRNQQKMGQVAQLSGIPGLQKAGAADVQDAQEQAMGLYKARQSEADRKAQRELSANENLQRSKDRAAALAGENSRADESRALRLTIAGMSTANHKMSINALEPEEQDALSSAINSGRLAPDKVNMRNQKVLAQALIADPATNLNKLIAAAAIQRSPTFQSKNIVVQGLPTLIKNMEDAGNKLDFSKYSIIGKGQAFLKDATNDPDYRNYMGKRNDAMMNIASVMRGVGMSDKAVELELEAAPKEMNPTATAAWARGQMSSLEPRLAKYNEINNLGDPPEYSPTAPTSSGVPKRVKVDAQGNLL